MRLVIAAGLRYLAVVQQEVPHTDQSTARKLVLISADTRLERQLVAHLETTGSEHYVFQRTNEILEVEGAAQMEQFDVVIIDMRSPSKQVLEWVTRIGGLRSHVALLAVCGGHDEIAAYRDLIHLIDDCIVPSALEPGELTARVEHAILRRRKEHSLMFEQSLLRSLLDNIPDAIYFKDLESRFIKVSTSMSRRYGHVGGELIGKTDFDLFTEAHARPAFEDEQRIIETGEPVIAKVEQETLPDGSVNWVNTTKLPLRDEYGRIVGTMGISRNITELKRAEDALNRERKLLRRIIDNVPAGIFVKDTRGRYQLVNKKHAAILGRQSVDQIVGTTAHDHVSDDLADVIESDDRKVFERGELVHHDNDRIVQDDGIQRWLMTSKVPLHDEDGAVFGLVGISQDVTARREMELRLRRTIETLHETQLRLIEAEKLKTVGRLAAGVAHEVKNPLAVVRLGVEYLQSQTPRELDGAEVEGMLKDMLAAVDKANEVIFELLDYSTPHELELVATDVNRVLNKVVAMLRHAFQNAGISVRKELAADLPPVLIDASKLDQVFMNLLLNSVGAMPEGGEIILRSYRRLMSATGSNVSSDLGAAFRVGDPMVVVEILDSGRGIPEHLLEKIFEPFFSTKETGEGTGLGLSVCKNIVDMHRGVIRLKNREDGPGACGQLFFPTPKSHDEHKTTQTPARAGGG